MKISEDLIQWLLADKKVSEGWRNLAMRLQLHEVIAVIMISPERNKLKCLFEMWRQIRPESYNVETLKQILSQEGFTDMYNWVNLMTITPGVRQKTNTTDSPFRRNQFASKSFSLQNRGKPRQIRSSPFSDFLYSPSPTYETISSPYSSYFENQSAFTHSATDDSGISLTSPGTVSPVCKVSQNQDENKTVYNVLYKPDLIKLSSPLRKSKTDIISQGIGRMTGTDYLLQNKEDYVQNWVKDTQNCSTNDKLFQ